MRCASVLAVLLIAGHAAAQEGMNVAGVTSLGTRYSGSTRVEVVGGKKLVKAFLHIDGVKGDDGLEGTVRLKAEVPDALRERKVVGIELLEQAPSIGATGALEGLTATDAKRFTLVPVLETNLTVEIVQGDGSTWDPQQEFLVGQRIELLAKVVTTTGDAVPDDAAKVQWTLPEGAWLRAYTVTTEQGSDGSALSFVHGRPAPGVAGDWLSGAPRYLGVVRLESEKLAPEHTQARALSFYWTREGTPTIGVEATPLSTAGQRVSLAPVASSVQVAVRRSDRPARDLFTRPLPGTFGELLPQHSNWHANYQGTDQFIYFHREMLRFYNSWRKLFGYLPVSAQLDPAEPGYGLSVDGFPYLTEQGGAIPSFRHQATSLKGFATAAQLGDDLESPYHNRGHGTIAAHPRGDPDMGSVARAPRTELFYQWHTKIDDVALEWEYLQEQGALDGIPFGAGAPKGIKGRIDGTGLWEVKRAGQLVGMAGLTPTRSGFSLLAKGPELEWTTTARWTANGAVLLPGSVDGGAASFGSPSGSVSGASDGKSFSVGSFRLERVTPPPFAFDVPGISVQQGTPFQVTLRAQAPPFEASSLVFVDGGFALLGTEDRGPGVIEVNLFGAEPGEHLITARLRGVAEPVATFVFNVVP